MQMQHRELAHALTDCLLMQRPSTGFAITSINCFPMAFHVNADRRICASLFLQQVLYYQPIFSFGWVIFWMVYLFSQVGFSLKTTALHDISGEGAAKVQGSHMQQPQGASEATFPLAF